MQQLIICKGLPGSGKTTFARKWVNESPVTRIRVNRDDIRRMLGPYWVPTREDLVTSLEREYIREGLKYGFSVIIDATNFKSEWVDVIHRNLSKFIQVELSVKDFTNVPIETCIDRDKNRPKEEQVGEEVIRNMAKKYNVS